MKVATTLLILLPAATADSQSVSEARRENPNLRGGGVVRKRSHRHDGHGLLEEFRQQRAHKKDVEDDADDVADAGGELVGPGKYLDRVDIHETSPARKSDEAHPAIFRTSRLSRGEMEKRAHEMEMQLQQVEDGTLQLNDKTVDRYKKFVERYNELEREIFLMNHPEEKEAEDANNKTIDNTADEKKKSTSAYSSGKAEYEHSIAKMKEKKQHVQKDNYVPGAISNVAKAAEAGEEKSTQKATADGNTPEFVYGADGTKQLRIIDDDEIDQLPDDPDKIGGIEIVSKGGISDTADGDDDDVPANFEGLSEGKLATNSAEKVPTDHTRSNAAESDDDDDVPPNFVGLSEGKIAPNTSKKATDSDAAEAGDDDIPTNFEGLDHQNGPDNVVVSEGAAVSVESSLEKVKKSADVVNTSEGVPEKSAEETRQKETYEKGDAEAPLVDGEAASTISRKEGDDGSEDAGTDEINKTFLPKLDSETIDGQESTERGMEEEKEDN